MNIFELAAKLSLDKSEFDSGINDAESSSSSLASTLGSTLSTAAKTGAAALAAVGTAATAVTATMIAGVNSTAEYGDNIDKASQKLGISSQAYQEWDAVLQHSGTSMSSMTSAFKTLANAAQDSSDDQVAAFERIGLSMDDVASMSTEDLFANVIYGLQGMEEGTERTALATDLLGRGAMEMGALLNTSAEDTQAMIDTVNQLGGVMSNDAVKASAAYEDSLQDLKTAISGAKRNLTADFLPSITEVMDGLTKLFVGDDSGFEQISEGVNSFVDGLMEAIPTITDAAGQILPSILTAINDNLPLLMSAGLDVIMTLAQGIIDNVPSLMDSAVQIIETIISGITYNFPQLVKSGAAAITSVANGLANNLPELIPQAVDMIITIVEALIDNVDQLIDAALKIIIALAEGLINSLPKLIEKAPVIISKLVNAIISEVPQLVRAGAQLITEMAGGLISALPSVLTAAAEIAVAIPRTISNGVSSMVDAGFQLVSGLWQGISNSWSSLVSNVQSLAGNLVSGVKSVLGIHSPSKVFAEIGDYCVQGMEEGLEPLANGSIMEDSLDAIRSFDGVSISASTSSQNSKVEALLAQIQDLLENQSIVLDTGALVGNTVRQYDKALGKRVALAGRGI